jgi:hypothetical protein
MASNDRGKQSFFPVKYVRGTAFKANDKRPNQLVAHFVPDGHAFLVL